MFTKFRTLSVFVVTLLLNVLPTLVMCTIRIASYNSTGLGSLYNKTSGPTPYIQTVTNQCDILFIQEHWLLEQQLEKVVSFLPGFTGTAISGMDSSSAVLRGRPFGGCAILWRNVFDNYMQPCNIKSMSRRICGCSLNTTELNILLLCVYFPTDHRAGDQNLTDLDLMLQDIKYFIDNTNCDKVIIGGDINCDFSRNTSFVRTVAEFISSHKLKVVWNNFNIDYTHIHTDDVSTSTIDHFFMSPDCYASTAFTLHHVDNTSRHCAIFMHVLCPPLPSGPAHAIHTDKSVSEPRCAWYKASENDTNKYKESLQTQLGLIYVNDNITNCDNIHCDDLQHRAYIDMYCKDIVCALEYANECIPKKSACNNKARLPGWNTHVKPYRDDATFWRRLWLQQGKPRSGTVAESMRSSRRSYHYAIRAIKQQDAHLRKYNFLHALLKGDRQFHKEVKKYKGVKSRAPTSVNSCLGEENIADTFASEYKALFNSCNYDSDFQIKFRDQISCAIDTSNASMAELKLYAADIRNAISHIKRNKSDGVFNLFSDNFINAPDSLSNHLANLLNLCLSHGHIPESLLLSTLIPIPKDRMGNMSNSQNYRGIALCAICLKIFEHVFLIKHSSVLSSSHYQFAYKEKSSTTQCTWIAREVISYYKANGSEVFSCLLDCSKAFDKIRFDHLFPKLLTKQVPAIVLRFLFNSYTNSSVQVRWRSATSEPFSISNGVRQGAVLSPFLFNIYMDELINDLRNEGSGCWIGSQYYGTLVYADDIMLLAPSVTALQTMILTCQKFGLSTGLEFNSKKTICINFHHSGKCNDSSSPPHVFLNGEKLKWCNSVKHLGHTVTCCLGFNKDVDIKKGQFITCVNNILTEFGFAHPSVKCKLMQIYGTSFYGCPLWDFYSDATNKLFTTWNIALRKMFNLPYRTHTRYLDIIASVKHLRFSLKQRFLSFTQSLWKSENPLVYDLTHFYVLKTVSPTGLHLARILSEYDLCSLSMYSSCDNVCLKRKYGSIHGLSD